MSTSGTQGGHNNGKWYILEQVLSSADLYTEKLQLITVNNHKYSSKIQKNLKVTN